MTTDNVLVSREKLEKLIEAVEYMSTCKQLRGSGQGQYKAILTMPDFIESERDVDEASKYIHHHVLHNDYSIGGISRAAINALRIKGGE